MGNNLMAHSSFSLFVACTEVNAYLAMKYFFKAGNILMNLNICLFLVFDRLPCAFSFVYELLTNKLEIYLNL